VTEQMVSDWICNDAQISDFPTSSVYDKARDIAGCDLLNNPEADWHVTSIETGKEADICVYYDSSWLDDTIDIDQCKLFPPK
jgi:hypothetical protein